jgi:hypothetical protein
MKPKVPNILMKKNPSFLHCISTIYLRACPKGKTYIGASINILTQFKSAMSKNSSHIQANKPEKAN